MIVRIDDVYRIETDELNCELIAERETKNPKTKEVNIRDHTLGYFSSVGSALRYLAKYEVRKEKKECNFEEYIALCDKELDRLNEITSHLDTLEG